MSDLVSRIQSSRLLANAVLVMAILHLVFLFAVWVPTNWPPDVKDIDSSIYYAVAKKAAAGVSLYTPKPEYGPDQRPFEYLYLPPFAAAIIPFGWLPETIFARLWFSIQLGFFFLFPALLVKLRGVALNWRSYLIAYFFLGGCLGSGICPGSIRAVALGQIDAMIWVGFGMGILWLLSAAPRRQMAAGIVLAAAALPKIYVGWALIRVARQRPQAFVAGMAVLASGLLLGLVICGPGSYATWLRYVPAQVGQGTFNTDNYSLTMAVLRVGRVLGWEYHSGPMTGLPVLWLKVSSLAAPALAVWLTRKQHPAMGAALCAITAALFGPICWTSYLAILLVPAALGLRLSDEKRTAGDALIVAQ